MENKITHMAEFRSILAGYTPSVTAQRVLGDIKLVLLLAPTAGGRNTIIDKLVATGNYHFIISDTTRHPRLNKGVMEQSGREYWFRTEDEMLEDLRHGAFLEAEVIHEQWVSGTSIRELERAQKLRKIAINEVDIGGVDNILKAKPDTLAILVIPPSFEEWTRRIDARGSMAPVERRHRFETAARIYEIAKAGTYPIVVNDNLDKAVSTVDAYVRQDKLNESEQTHGRQLATDLYTKTRAYLASIE